MDLIALGRFVSYVEPCFYHNLDGYWRCLERAREALAQAGCREEWMPVVMVMAQGASYYGEDDWLRRCAVLI